ncbi:MAG: zf-HC2 domain-containing protein [Gammaproteobacteria bacterium]|nr:zf-HC2 domain-containing protein [Gammaproteobacteria bacterium]
MLRCKDIPERASAYVERDLGRRERAMFRLHLMLCSHCRRFMRQFRTLLGAFGRKRPPALAEAHVERIVKALREQQREE